MCVMMSELSFIPGGPKKHSTKFRIFVANRYLLKYYLKTAINISQGSVATRLRCGGIILMATLLQTYCWVRKWMNFFERSIVDAVVSKTWWLTFLDHPLECFGFDLVWTVVQSLFSGHSVLLSAVLRSDGWNGWKSLPYRFTRYSILVEPTTAQCMRCVCCNQCGN